MVKIKKNAYYLVVLCLLFIVFGYFYRISYLTPLAGDDWGYAINGMAGNPIKTLLYFYQNWSGRLLSEFWGLMIAPRKWLWNILNAFIFAGIFLCLLLNGNTKKDMGGISVALVLIFTVSEYLRMETYTWIMGTTYAIPLFLSLFYFYLVEKNVFSSRKMSIFKVVGTSLACLLIGVSMENIAAMMIIAIVLILGYCFFKEKKFRVDFICNLLCSVLSFMIMRLSPGSTNRLIRDHLAWTKMTLFEKIENQLSNFFTYTFIENKYLIFILSLTVIAVLVFKGIKWIKKNKMASSVIFITQGIALFFCCSNVLSSKLNIEILQYFLNADSLLVRLWWISYIFFTFFAIIMLIENVEVRIKAIFYIMLAGGCNLIMLYSPIFGSRSSLYFVYFMIVVILLLYSQISFSYQYFEFILFLVGLFFTVLRSSAWMGKYELVHSTQVIRDAEIEYYRQNPDEDAWICRMPPYSVHAADIEDDDTYHQEVFREYYGLDPEQKIIFYWKDSYE